MIQIFDRNVGWTPTDAPLPQSWQCIDTPQGTPESRVYEEHLTYFAYTKNAHGHFQRVTVADLNDGGLPDGVFLAETAPSSGEPYATGE